MWPTRTGEARKRSYIKFRTINAAYLHAVSSISDHELQRVTVQDPVKRTGVCMDLFEYTYRLVQGLPRENRLTSDRIEHREGMMKVEPSGGIIRNLLHCTLDYAAERNQDRLLVLHGLP